VPHVCVCEREREIERERVCDTNTREKYVLKTENTSNTHTITSFRKSGLKLKSGSQGLIH
jgi:hypothetical protein